MRIRRIFYRLNKRPGLKNQEWGGLETPIHNWSLWSSLQLMIWFNLIWIKCSLGETWVGWNVFLVKRDLGETIFWVKHYFGWNDIGWNVLGETFWVKRDRVKRYWANCYHTIMFMYCSTRMKNIIMILILFF